MRQLSFKTAVVVACAAAAFSATAQVKPVAAAAPASAMSDKERLSYATGVVSVRNFTRNDIAFDIDAIVRGMRDAMAGKELALSEKEIRLVMNQLQTDLRRSMASNRKDLLDKNRQRGADFVAAYKARPDVQSLGNGIAYRVLQPGTGARPTEQDTVEVKYRGSLTDGTEFDATAEGRTAMLRMNSVIMGWREALKQMPVGSKWQIVVPHQLAYGERGAGDMIGPNETLVFDVELVAIKR